MVSINLFVNADRARGSGEIHTTARCVVFNLVGAALAVKHLNDLSIFGIHDDELARLIKMSGLHAAPDEQPVMAGIECERVLQRASGYRPRGDDGTLLPVNHSDRS